MREGQRVHALNEDCGIHSEACPCAPVLWAVNCRKRGRARERLGSKWITRGHRRQRGILIKYAGEIISCYGDDMKVERSVHIGKCGRDIVGCQRLRSDCVVFPEAAVNGK